MNLISFEEKLKDLDCQQIEAKMLASNIERAFIPDEENFIKAITTLKGDRIVFVERQGSSVWFYLVFHGLAFYTYFNEALNRNKEMQTK